MGVGVGKEKFFVLGSLWVKGEAGLGVAADGFPVGKGREVLVTLELAVEIGRGGIAALVGDLFHGFVGLGE